MLAVSTLSLQRAKSVNFLLVSEECTDFISLLFKAVVKESCLFGLMFKKILQSCTKMRVRPSSVKVAFLLAVWQMQP